MGVGHPDLAESRLKVLGSKSGFLARSILAYVEDLFDAVELDSLEDLF